MTLTERELRLALYCTAEELRAREAGKAPGPQAWLYGVLRALKTELSVTASRHSVQDEQQHSNHDTRNEIGSGDAATILGWNPRTVQRRATELAGRKVSGKYLFCPNIIQQIAEEQSDARYLP